MLSPETRHSNNRKQYCLSHYRKIEFCLLYWEGIKWQNSQNWKFSRYGTLLAGKKMRFILLIIGTAGKGRGEEGTRIVISRNSFGYETRETQQKVILKGLKRIFLVCSTLAQVFAFIWPKISISTKFLRMR